MNGDIALYEVRVRHPGETFTYRGRDRTNGKRLTCVHKLMIAAFSRESAESLARFHCFRKLGKHVDDVHVSEVEGRVADLGLWVFRNDIMKAFCDQCETQANKESQSCE